MGSETTSKLPIIDFTNINFEANNHNWESVKSQVHKALTEYGCFEAVIDKVPLDQPKTIFTSVKELFDLPLQTKLLNVTSNPYYGYIGQHPANPLYETIGFENPHSSENIESMTNIFWPNGNPSFSKSIYSFSKQLIELDHIVRKMILENLGVEKYLEEHMDSTDYVLRVMQYKSPQTSDTELGLISHTDKNMVTILHQNQVDGLEVLTKDGKWISYKPSSAHSFVVFSGDSFHAWSNGRLHSSQHKVMMSGNVARYCLGLFTISKAEGIIKAPEELVDAEHPLLFNPFSPTEFIKYCYADKGKRSQSTLHDYCGV